MMTAKFRFLFTSPVGIKIVGWFLAIGCSLGTSAQTFTEVVFPGVPQLTLGQTVWGDYDNDGDQDLLVAGWDGNEPITRLYNKQGNALKVVKFNGANVHQCAIGFTDFNNDGYLDIYLSGKDKSGKLWTQFWKNQHGNSFEEIKTSVPGVLNGKFEWFDFNQDLKLDLLISGTLDSGLPYTALFKNLNGMYVQTSVQFQQVSETSVVIGTDQTPFDFMVSGKSQQGNWVTNFYQWKGDALASPFDPIKDLKLQYYIREQIYMIWNDFDQDGYQDCLINGFNDENYFYAMIYRYDPNLGYVGFDTLVYESAEQKLGISSTGSALGDVNGDGDVDVVLYQVSDSGPHAIIYTNDGSGHMTKIQEFQLDPNIFEVFGFQLVDVNNDNAPELIQNGFWGEMYLFYNLNGVFDERPQFLQGGFLLQQPAFADLDNDGDLDYLAEGNAFINNLTPGTTGGTVTFNPLYSNVNTSNLNSLRPQNNAWIDLDGDGFLDPLILTYSGQFGAFRNLQGTDFAPSDIQIFANGANKYRGRWIKTEDFDLDGDLDLIISGEHEIDPALQTYGLFVEVIRNEGGGVFNRVDAVSEQLSTIYSKKDGILLDLVDFNNDNLPDLHVISNANSSQTSQIYINKGNLTFQSQDLLSRKEHMQVVQANFNNSTENQFLSIGEIDNKLVVEVVTFGVNGEEILKTIENPMASASIELGDFDTNGSLDIVLSGIDTVGTPRSVMVYNSGGLNFSVTELPSMSLSASISAGDFNSDELLDFTLVSNQEELIKSHVYQNSGGIAVSPSPPGSVNHVVSGNQVTIAWDVGSDNATASNELTYNLLVYSDSDTLISGFQNRMSDSGNQGFKKEVILPLDAGTYYAQVQSVDNGRLVGAFSVVDTIHVNSLSTKMLFLEIPQPTQAYFGGDSKWVDFDRDGNMDFFTIDDDLALYRNDNGIFIRENMHLPDAKNAKMDWGDFDNDNDLDLLLGSSLKTSIYENRDGQLVELSNLGSLVIPPYKPGFFGNSKMEWNDLNADGYLDFYILTPSEDVFVDISKFYLNDQKGGFKEIELDIESQRLFRFEFVDINNDGFKDVFTIAGTIVGGPYPRIYLNKGDLTFDPFISLPNTVWNYQGDIGDMDGDGDLDVMFADTRLLKNENGSFIDLGLQFESLPGLDPNSFEYDNAISSRSVFWKDYDGDGDLDVILFSNNNSSTPIIAQNNGNQGFTRLEVNIPGLSDYELADYDSDGDLDILSTFVALPSGQGKYILSIFQNQSIVSPSVIPQPTNLISNRSNLGIHLEWAAPSQTGFTYNVRIRKGDQYLLAPQALENGTRFIVKRGNAGALTSINFGPLDPGTYTWSVQCINSTGAGGAFSEEATFEIQNFELKSSLSFITYINTFDLVDYDNDQDMDIFVGGTGILPDGSIKNAHILYENLGDFTFSAHEMTAINSYRSSSAWGDYNNDGLMDLAITGGRSNQPTTQLFINRGAGNFDRLVTAYEGVNRYFTLEGTNKSIGWIDYDNDGNQDLIFGGSKSTNFGFSLINNEEDKIGGRTILLKNEGSKLEDSGLGRLFSNDLFDVFDFADYDGDGRTDIAVYHQSFTNAPTGAIYSFNDSTFNELKAYSKVSSSPLKGVEWADTDGDNDLDLFMNGFLYENKGEGFLNSDVVTEDFGNAIDIDGNQRVDGFPDLNARNALVTINNGGGDYKSMDLAASFQDASLVTILGFGDLNGDRKPDMVAFESGTIKIFENNYLVDVPTIEAPQPLEVNQTEGAITLNWEQVANGYTYNVYIRDEKFMIVSSMSHTSGFRKTTAKGNAFMNTFYWLTRPLPDGKYYWGVQAIGPNQVGGPFCAEQSFIVCNKFEVDFAVDDRVGVNAYFEVVPSVISEDITYDWDFGDGSFSDEQQPSHRYLEEGDFPIILQTQDSLGCTFEASHEISIVEMTPVHIATLMSPNGDGKNDILYIENIERYPENTLRLVNMYGQEVFSASGYANTWDGTWQGSVLPPGSYICFLKLSEVDFEIKQVISLVK